MNCDHSYKRKWNLFVLHVLLQSEKNTRRTTERIPVLVKDVNVSFFPPTSASVQFRYQKVNLAFVDDDSPRFLNQSRSSCSRGRISPSLALFAQAFGGCSLLCKLLWEYSLQFKKTWRTTFLVLAGSEASIPILAVTVQKYQCSKVCLKRISWRGSTVIYDKIVRTVVPDELVLAACKVRQTAKFVFLSGSFWECVIEILANQFDRLTIWNYYLSRTV